MPNLTNELKRERDEHAVNGLYWCPRCSSYKPSQEMQKRGIRSKSRYGYGPYCLECDRERRNTPKQKEEKRKYNRRYYLQNREQLIIYGKKWRNENKDYTRRYEAKRSGTEKRKEQNRKYRNSLPLSEKRRRARISYKKYKNRLIELNHNRYHTEDGKAKHRIWQSAYRARKRNLVSDLTHEQWKKALDHFNNKCAYCLEGKVTDQDHFIPVSKNGGYTASNIVPACDSCNSSKRNIDAIEWAKYRDIPLERINKIKIWLHQNHQTSD